MIDGCQATDIRSGIEMEISLGMDVYLYGCEIYWYK